MLPFNVSEGGGLGGLELILPLLLCCMMPTMCRQGGGGQAPQGGTDSDSWYVTYGIQEAYDDVVKEVDGWRENALATRKKSRFAFLSRSTPKVYVVDEEVPPRLFSLQDDRAGDVSFELMVVGDGGTTIKATYDVRARPLIQKFKAKMPVKILASGSKVCPSCGKEMMPDFKTCPYCGTKIE